VQLVDEKFRLFLPAVVEKYTKYLFRRLRTHTKVRFRESRYTYECLYFAISEMEFFRIDNNLEGDF